jgi:hypothetical protein
MSNEDSGRCDNCNDYGWFWAECKVCKAKLCGRCGCAVARCPVCDAGSQSLDLSIQKGNRDSAY